MPPEAPTQAPPRRRELALWLGGLTVVALAVVGVVVGMGGRIEAATWGLVVAASAMVFALHSLYRMATVLSQPAVEVVLDQDDVAALSGRRELREERRRVLRAINELQFDYEMGKLSSEDYQAVRQGYELRAVEVMRALDAEPSLHPQLEVELRRRGLLEGGLAGPVGAKDDDAEEEASDSASKPSWSDEEEASGVDAEEAPKAETSDADEAGADDEETEA